MKLDPRLWSSARLTSPAKQPDGSYEIYVSAFRGVPASAVASALQKLVPGVRITAQSLRADAAQYVRASVGVSALDGLLRAATSIDGVAFVEPWIQPRYHNSGAIGAIQGNSTAACPGSGPVCGPTPIWDHGILGTGQIAGIADSGTTPNAAWFTTLEQGQRRSHRDHVRRRSAAGSAGHRQSLPGQQDPRLLGAARRVSVRRRRLPRHAHDRHAGRRRGRHVRRNDVSRLDAAAAESRARRRHGAERAAPVPGHRRRFVDVGHRARFRRHASNNRSTAARACTTTAGARRPAARTTATTESRSRHAQARRHARRDVGRQRRPGPEHDRLARQREERADRRRARPCRLDDDRRLLQPRTRPPTDAGNPTSPRRARRRFRALGNTNVNGTPTAPQTQSLQRHIDGRADDRRQRGARAPVLRGRLLSARRRRPRRMRTTRAATS